MPRPEHHNEAPRVLQELDPNLNLSPPRRLARWALDILDASLIDRLRTRKPRDPKQRATHTSEELQAIAKAFGPGADVALRSIQRSSGYKVTVNKRSS